MSSEQTKVLPSEGVLWKERRAGGPLQQDLRVTFLGLLSVSFGGPLVGVVEGRRVYAVARIPEHPQPRSVHLPWEAPQVI